MNSMDESIQDDSIKKTSTRQFKQEHKPVFSTCIQSDGAGYLNHHYLMKTIDYGTRFPE